MQFSETCWIRWGCHATGLILNEWRERAEICSASVITQANGAVGVLGSPAETASTRRSLLFTAAIIIIIIKEPVVIMGRHPAAKPSVLQVEINGARGSWWALHNVLKGPNSGKVERQKEINSDGVKESESLTEQWRMKCFYKSDTRCLTYLLFSFFKRKKN